MPHRREKRLQGWATPAVGSIKSIVSPARSTKTFSDVLLAHGRRAPRLPGVEVDAKLGVAQPSECS